MPRSRNLAALATVLCCVLWPACALAGPAAAGRVRFLRGAESSFDVYTRAPSLAGQAWMRSHYARMRTYAPYFDSRLRWYRNAWTYKDAYAIYPGSRLHSASARFVLRD